MQYWKKELVCFNMVGL